MHVNCIIEWRACADAEGERGSGPPPSLKNDKILGFLAILVQIPWIITKLSSQRSMLSHHWHSSETPHGVSLAGRWWPAFSGIWIPSSTKNEKKKRFQSWTPSEEKIWIRAWRPYFWIKYSYSQAKGILKALKDIFETLKHAAMAWLTYVSKRQSGFAISRGF